MHLDRTQHLERGMQLVPKLPEIMPEQAGERIRPIYEDIQRTLHVPFVNFIFRTLANYPDYLESAWNSSRPVLRTRAFEQAADQLRARALLEPVPSAENVDWESIGEMERLRAYTDSIHYVLPKLLLIATAWDEALLEERDRSSSEGGVPSGDIPLGIASGTIKVQMVDPKEAAGRVKELFEDIKQSHDHPGVASYYRSLGNWPEFLNAAWHRIRPRVGSAPYSERKRSLIDIAGSAVRELPFEQGATPGMDSEQTGKIRSILSVFRLRLIPDLLLDVTLLKAMLDGSEAARSSRFSVVDWNA